MRFLTSIEGTVREALLSIERLMLFLGSGLPPARKDIFEPEETLSLTVDFFAEEEGPSSTKICELLCIL